MRKIPFLVLIIFLLITSATQAQLTLNTSVTATQLAQRLAGPGVTVMNPVLTCPSGASAIFTATNSNLGLGGGVLLTTGYAQTNASIFQFGADGPAAYVPDNPRGAAGSSALGTNTFDACTLEFDFVPIGDTISFRYVFASEEYSMFNCTKYNDRFKFYISGNSASGDMAVVPGTSIPVAINSINSGVPGPNGDISNCQSMGTGSPFPQYYVDNTNGTTITYDGFTVPLIAKSPVQSCDTYHLVMVVADVVDDIVDSGVFLEEGSLTSKPVTLRAIGGANGVLNTPKPYCVRGCAAGKFEINRHSASPYQQKIRYELSGSAVNGYDYTAIQSPGRAVIPANDSLAYIIINPQAVPGGSKKVKIRIFQPCDTLNVLDSTELLIMDSVYAKIQTNDTVICKGDTVHILASKDPSTTFTWTPTLGLIDPNVLSPFAKPDQTTNYQLTVSVPGCPDKHDGIAITVRQPAHVDLGPDKIVCLNTQILMDAVVTPANQQYQYLWTPSSGLNNSNVQNPEYTPTTAGDYSYVLSADPGASGRCVGRDTVNIHVMPDDFVVYLEDTAICKGDIINVSGSADPNFSWHWSPATGVSDVTVFGTSITTDTTRTYTVTAHYGNCPDVTKAVHIEVQPNPTVYIGADVQKCYWDTVHFHPVVGPSWYHNYTYSWQPPYEMADPDQPDTWFFGHTTTNLTLVVTTPAGCKGSDDVLVTVFSNSFASVNPADTGICPRDSAQLHVSGGVSWQWFPADYLSATNLQDVTVTPWADMHYTIVVKDEHNCPDTLQANVAVHSNAVINLPDTVIAPENVAVQLDAGGNCLYYNWFPPLGLSDVTIGNPMAMPPVNTRYIVEGRTEAGCVAKDSVTVLVDPTVYVKLPNAYSPLSPSANELKLIYQGDVQLKSFRIYNRWGQKVFETTNLNQGWDGRLNGELCAMGVYVYIIEATGKNGKSYNTQGNVTLIR
ncbi:choice-of-anchor L domain-containing protein [Taibaiella soli]|nr:choice-of-anchor L domain-containing protein [Taibaiella soli]